MSVVHRLVAVAGGLAVLAAGAGVATPAAAQTPTPTVSMVSRNDIAYPTSVPKITVVQGDEFCSKGGNSQGLSELESITNQLVGNNKAAISEITVYGPCKYSVQTYENDIDALAKSVQSAHPNKAPIYWYGVMLDEESAYGVSVNDLHTINSQAQNTMLKDLPVGSNGFFYSPWIEVFMGCGDWTSAQFLKVVSPYYNAPQVSTQCMVNVVNSNYRLNVVTWSTTYPSPYNTEAKSDNAISGMPPELNPDGTSRFYDNQFIAS